MPNVTSRRLALSPVVSRDRLLSLSQLVGSNYRFQSPSLDHDQAVLDGHFQVSTLRPGLILRCADTRDLHDMQTQAELKPALKLIMLLQGSADVSFGYRRLTWPALGEPGVGQDAALISLAQPDLFVRRARRGNAERSVTLTLTQEWLLNSPLVHGPAWPAIESFATTHLSLLRWQPSPRMRALAEQISRPAVFTAGLQSLYQESRCIEMIGEALSGVTARVSTPGCSQSVGPRAGRKLSALRELLDSGAADDASLAVIARQVGMTVNAMQSGFRALTGKAVFEYLRYGRLERARRALERDGASVAEATAIAGYSSTANFSTAFRREFGLTPRQSQGGL